MTVQATPMLWREIPRFAPQIEQNLEASALCQIYQNCLIKLAESNQRITEVNRRLAKIDPHFVGEERTGNLAKYYIKRIKKKDEVKYLQYLKKLNLNISIKYSKISSKVEKDLQQFLASESVHRYGLLSQGYRTGKRLVGKAVRTVKSAGQLLDRKKIEKLVVTDFVSPQQTPEEARKLIMDFIAELPLFKENPRIKEVLEKQFPMLPHVRVTLQGSDMLQIECPKTKVKIDPTRIISKEECRQIDPENPLLDTAEPITVNDLKRFGSIDPSWWEWLKEKQYPTFGPRVILKREGNALNFLKGASLLDAIAIEEKKVVFKAFCFEKVCEWNAEDFISFLTKFTSVIN